MWVEEVKSQSLCGKIDIHYILALVTINDSGFQDLRLAKDATGIHVRMTITSFCTDNELQKLIAACIEPSAWQCVVLIAALLQPTLYYTAYKLF